MDDVENVKTLLTSPTVLSLPRTTGQYKLNINECHSQVGCVLLQHEEDGIKRPIRYYSRILTSAEQKLETTHKEDLAVLWAMSLLPA